MKAKLVLEDGSCFEGISIGVPGEKIGEVILNTTVVGYQEMMTDPANAGKILVLTYPLIGNYGIAEKFNESKKCWLEGLIIKESSKMYSNWQAEDSFENFLSKEKTVAISEIDTRTLAVKIRDNGEMLGIISTQDTNEKKLLQKLQKAAKNIKKNFIKEISVKEVTKIKPNSSGSKIAILDLGITNGFIKQLKTLGCNITLLPYDTDADKILKSGFDAVVISNGPEADEAIPIITQTTKKLLGKIPVLGISTGHEIIALALGGKLKKMAMGHRGVNYPVKSPDSFKGEITVQNHSFIVDEDSIKNRKDTRVTLRNVNDNSIEEMESKSLKFISTQYYPLSPGFDEVNEVFKRFLKMMEKTRKS
ncbi:MAG: glutamine-hydrolyzing carbamoyl-phosphate synthase small subunit [Candidatus Omnitrophica bacterium]|nr:glutamine-hydrolyzing carbamoyl-phosphate synthase small subunit [Candidatus Omnitrophota bacterium]MBU1047434.1 glutamine-hydrolyzing carbamoyl-phosphate synthase small subunit [Candidatus Omnitrophota bacterium]MBU1767419.1 glutamine-hydrolyzing carbamoyl-phosphate synthase small subunit [Candidatus Omnitrophota bacterium]MBU1888797.1 glutamine-hydrolyzing carbamoyl-phosphate synthase small subunit [Candidatus Omnitrophota bacterium]